MYNFFFLFPLGKNKLICQLKPKGVLVGLGMAKVKIELGSGKLYPNSIPTGNVPNFCLFSLSFSFFIKLQKLFTAQWSIFVMYSLELSLFTKIKT